MNIIKKKMERSLKIYNWIKNRSYCSLAKNSIYSDIRNKEKKNKFIMSNLKQKNQDPFWINYNLINYLKYPEIWILVYEKIKKNKNANIIKKLENLKYEIVFQNIFRKKNSSIQKNEFDIISRNLILKYVIQFLLHFIYDPLYVNSFKFSTFFHVLQKLKNFLFYLNYISSSKKPNWIITGKIRINQMNEKNDKILMKILEKKIQDKKILDIIWTGLKTTNIGYSSKNKNQIPVLLKIYLNEFDLLFKNATLNFLNIQISNFFYIRYKNHFILFLNGEANSFITYFPFFLKQTLNLDLLEIHLSPINSDFSFLHYIIKTENNISFYANTQDIIYKLYKLGFCKKNGEPKPCLRFIHKTQKYTNFYIKKKIINIYTYFKFAINRKFFIKRIIYILRNSLAMMYAAKYKLKTRAQVFKKAGKNLDGNF